MKLINYAHKFWRLYSVWIFAVIAAGAMAEERWSVVSRLVPAQYQQGCLAILGIIGIIGRLLKQDKLQAKKKRKIKKKVRAIK